MNKTLQSYKIEGGNSSTGLVGFVLYLRASSPADALERAKEKLLAHQHGFKVSGITGKDEFLVYFNPNALTLENVTLDE